MNRVDKALAAPLGRDQSTRPRLAWLHSHFLLWSGGTKFVFEVAKRVNRTFAVDMIVEKCAPKIREMYAAEGIEIIELTSRSSTSMLYWALFPWFVRQDIARLRALKGDYAAFVASMFPMSFVAKQAGATPLVSYVLEPFAFFHDPDMIAGFPTLRRQLLRGLAAAYKRFDVAGIQASRDILTINAGTADWIRRIYDRSSETTLLGVDTEVFAPRSSKLAARYAGRKVLIHSTDFTPLKRTGATLDAVADLRGDVPSVKLLITCSQDLPSEMARLQAEIDRRGLSEHVELLGHVAHAELPHYYALADVSLYTGVGRGASAASLFVLECMAAGTPGVRTNFTDDEVQDGVSGFLVPPDDRAALKKALVEILTNDALRAQFAVAARRRVVERYSWDNVVARFIDKLAPAAAARG